MKREVPSSFLPLRSIEPLQPQNFEIQLTKMMKDMIVVKENQRRSNTTVDTMIHQGASTNDEDTVVSAARALLGLSPTTESDRLHISSVFREAPSMPIFLELPSSLVSCSESSSDISLDGGQSECSDRADTRQYYPGEVSLALPDDEESLSPLHCFMRRYCVEAFSATPEDISTTRHGKCHGGRIVAGQVGIRCLHCKHRPTDKRQERAICFPSSVGNIYHSIETWQRRHSLVCQDIPIWVKKCMSQMMENSRASGGGRRQYWQESAMRLGFANTRDGIRFIRPPGDSGDIVRPGDEIMESCPQNEVPHFPVVDAVEKPLVTEYLFLLLDQMETCQFTEQDRTGGRSKVKDYSVGYPGMQCKHCAGKAGFGRYFPANLHALTSANSDRNIHNHITKCRRCPKEVRDELNRLQEEQSQCKNRRGSRKLFFEHIWSRLHGQKICASNGSC